MSTTVAVTISSGVAIALVVQFIKSWVEQWFLPSSNPAHDITIQVMAALIGVIGFEGNGILMNTLTRGTFSDLAAQGAVAGLSAIGTYHLIGATRVSTVAPSSIAVPTVTISGAGQAGQPPVFTIPPTRSPTPTIIASGTVTEGPVV